MPRLWGLAVLALTLPIGICHAKGNRLQARIDEDDLDKDQPLPVQQSISTLASLLAPAPSAVMDKDFLIPSTIDKLTFGSAASITVLPSLNKDALLPAKDLPSTSPKAPISTAGVNDSDKDKDQAQVTSLGFTVSATIPLSKDFSLIQTDKLATSLPDENGGAILSSVALQTGTIIQDDKDKDKDQGQATLTSSVSLPTSIGSTKDDNKDKDKDKEQPQASITSIVATVTSSSVNDDDKDKDKDKSTLSAVFSIHTSSDTKDSSKDENKDKDKSTTAVVTTSLVVSSSPSVQTLNGPPVIVYSITLPMKSEPESGVQLSAAPSTSSIYFPVQPTPVSLTVPHETKKPEFPGYQVVPSPNKDKDRFLSTNSTKTIPVWTQELLGNAYGGGYVTTASIYVTKLPFPSGPKDNVPPGYGSSSQPETLPLPSAGLSSTPVSDKNGTAYIPPVLSATSGGKDEGSGSSKDKSSNSTLVKSEDKGAKPDTSPIEIVKTETFFEVQHGTTVEYVSPVLVPTGQGAVGAGSNQLGKPEPSNALQPNTNLAPVTFSSESLGTFQNTTALPKGGLPTPPTKASAPFGQQTSQIPLFGSLIVASPGQSLGYSTVSPLASAVFSGKAEVGSQDLAGLASSQNTSQGAVQPGLGQQMGVGISSVGTSASGVPILGELGQVSAKDESSPSTPANAGETPAFTGSTPAVGSGEGASSASKVNAKGEISPIPTAGSINVVFANNGVLMSATGFETPNGSPLAAATASPNNGNNELLVSATGFKTPNGAAATGSPNNGNNGILVSATGFETLNGSPPAAATGSPNNGNPGLLASATGFETPNGSPLATATAPVNGFVGSSPSRGAAISAGPEAPNASPLVAPTAPVSGVASSPPNIGSGVAAGSAPPNGSPLAGITASVNNAVGSSPNEVAESQAGLPTSNGAPLGAQPLAGGASATPINVAGGVPTPEVGNANGAGAGGNGPAVGQVGSQNTEIASALPASAALAASPSRVANSVNASPAANAESLTPGAQTPAPNNGSPQGQSANGVPAPSKALASGQPGTNAGEASAAVSGAAAEGTGSANGAPIVSGSSENGGGQAQSNAGTFQISNSTGSGPSSGASVPAIGSNVGASSPGNASAASPPAASSQVALPPIQQLNAVPTPPTNSTVPPTNGTVPPVNGTTPSTPSSLPVSSNSGPSGNDSVSVQLNPTSPSHFVGGGSRLSADIIITTGLAGLVVLIAFF